MNYTAQTFPFFHEIKSLIDILEQEIMGDKLIDHELLHDNTSWS